MPESDSATHSRSGRSGNVRRRKKVETRRRQLSLFLHFAIVIILAGLAFYIGKKVEGQTENQKDADTAANAGVSQSASDTDDGSGGESTYGTGESSDCIIVLDPGHGGNDAGAVAAYGSQEVYEKDINLAIALLTKTFLEDEGCTVLLTRSSDVYVSLDDRAEFSNENNASLFVSIHQNSLENDTETSGVETWYWAGSASGMNLAASLQSSLVEYTGAENLGIKSSTELYVLHHTNAPSVLVECGFMSSVSELARLLDTSCQEEIAEGICDGIVSCLSEIR